MDFALDERQRGAREQARAFAVSVSDDEIASHDRAGAIPAAIIARVAELGVLGGQSDYVAYVAALEEISRGWASLGAIVSVHNSLVCYPISKFGDDAQKKKFLVDLTERGRLGCYAFAEPSAGSDAGAIQTTARLDGNQFVLNGRKRFVTSGRQAAIIIVYAVTDPSLGRDGLSAFIVEKESAGCSVGKTEETLGLRGAEIVQLQFDDCRIPKDNLLGGLNQGFAVARGVVERARIDIAAQSTGIAQACLDHGTAQAKSRRQFGRPIAEFEAIQWMLADMATEIDAARLMTFRAASLEANRPGDGKVTIQAAMAKLFASEIANKAAYNALQIFGGRGYLTEFPMERYYRDARAMTLYEETSEIERLVIERELAKE